MVLKEKTAIYKNTKFVTAEMVSVDMGFPSNFMVMTALGCRRRAILLFTNFNKIKIRMTFMPPLVEEEDPPINMSMNKSILLKVGHKSKLAFMYPVVVIIETLWKDAYRRASPGDA